jgi:hypothetical protein
MVYDKGETADFVFYGLSGFFWDFQNPKIQQNVLLKMKEFRAEIFITCRPRGSYNILKVSAQTDVLF